MVRFSVPLLVLLASLVLESGIQAATPVDFAHEIVPILRESCGECHTGDKKKGGLSFNTRESLLKGGEEGAVVVPGDVAHSRLIEAVTTSDPEKRMPPKGQRLTPEQVAKLKAWIAGGAVWTEGFSFKKPTYEPPLKPRRPELPKVRQGRTNLVDRILDAQMAQQKTKRPAPLDDAAFARRVTLDLVGLLPEPAALAEFLADRRADKRSRWVDRWLTNEVAYAEHWMSFWNDLLRNDYAGTGFIDGGRRQISTWLYRSLIENKPYDQMARELVSPTPESEGFSRGIQWRGEVSAGQVVPVQFAQSIGQTFLGINLKCASCHDSFIDRWTLQDAYGLAAIYSEKPLQLHRCDKPTGKMATPAWLFPEIGQVDASKPQPERLKQLAGLLTHPENGRFSRTIVNRLWHRLMGRGIVHPTDAMQTEPWNVDLLDGLASHLADNHYDLKATLALIAKSSSYQSQAEVRGSGRDDHGYRYAGPRAKRLTAEQFIDALWQITDTAPKTHDAPVVRGRMDPSAAPSAHWIWSSDSKSPAGGEVVTFRKYIDLSEVPTSAGAAITADNAYALFVNGHPVKSDDNWETVESVELTPVLKVGSNEIVIRASNGGSAPNPAGLFFQMQWRFKDGLTGSMGTGAKWEMAASDVDEAGKLKNTGAAWTAAVEIDDSAWRARVAGGIQEALNQARSSGKYRVRASLMKSDLLQRTLGRPNREQIVSVRPEELSTLEAMDLSNGSILAGELSKGAKKLLTRDWKSSDALIDYLYVSALSRSPNKGELELARTVMGTNRSVEGLEDFLWSLILLPEFQLIR